MLYARIGDHLTQHVCKILKYDDCFGPGVPELVFKFTARVQRVDVDGNQPGTKNTGERNRVLQRIPMFV